jgi:tRNA pseudouridine38-40 synthase
LGVLLSVAYDGRPYHGFVEQPGQSTVAGELLTALRQIDPTIARLDATSRTDRGVHARDQRVAFVPARPLALTAWTHGAQKHLPNSISIRRAWEVADDFFPRGHVVSKTYRYTLLFDEVRDPFCDGFVWRLTAGSRDEACRVMAEEAQALVGTHDFSAFRGAQDERESAVRTLLFCNVSPSPHDPRVAWVDVCGTGFLYHMVRIIVGTLVDVARGRRKPGTVQRALVSGDRREGGITAPPDGLCLQSYDLSGIDSP